MRKKDIKIGEYYYGVHGVHQLFSKHFSVKSMVERFKMTDDILITNPKNIFKSYLLAKLKAVIILNKFRDEQLKKIWKMEKKDDKINFTGIYNNDGVDK